MDVPTDEEALQCAAKIAVACRRAPARNSKTRHHEALRTPLTRHGAGLVMAMATARRFPQLIVGWVSTRDLSAGEREVYDPARGADCLDIKAIFQSLESVPESLSAPKDYGGDHNVHVID